MEIGLQFHLLWNDVDGFQLRICAWNGEFAGTADVYVPIGGLAQAAEKLEHFPRDPADQRDLQFGQFGPEWAGGAVGLRFYCKGSAGHTFVEVRVESEYGSKSDHPETAHFFAPVEASAVDDFVAGLRRLEPQKNGVARLRITVPAPNYAAMTVNERLFAAGVRADYENAVRQRNRERVLEILRGVQLSDADAQAVADTVLR